MRRASSGAALARSVSAAIANTERMKSPAVIPRSAATRDLQYSDQLQIPRYARDDNYLGSVSATSEVFAPCPIANTTYCLPLCMNVIGTAVDFDGMRTAPT